MVEWSKIREYFPAAKRYTYLNAAACSPISQQVEREVKEYYKELLMNGDIVWKKWLEKKEEVREKVANLLNADRKEVAFISNTSHGMNIIAQMLRGKGEVITMEDEFPSSTFPWINLNYKIHFVKPRKGTYPVEEIEKNITSKTKILVTSHVQFKTGFRQDLIEVGNLCKRRGLIYVVNATQSIAAFDIDVAKAGIDFLVFSCHKWPMAGYGIGAIYINSKWFKLKYPVAGWQSVKNPDLMDNKKLDLKKDASVLEVGGLHFPGIFALGTSLDLLNEIGRSNIQKRILELNRYLIQRLKKSKIQVISPVDEKFASGIVLIKVENPQEVAKKLLREGIIVSVRGEGLRISFHVYNNKEDIQRFIIHLTKIIKS
jgi:selenocysteine lyase/cysteine desulfurase